MKLKTLLCENVKLDYVNSLNQLKGITDVVDVIGDVNLSHKKLIALPVKFGKVGRYFNCNYNLITSLEGCPTEVGGNFNCYNNDLTSLEGCPTEVGGSFSCSGNHLTSLEGCPSEVGGSFSCDDNNLTSLEGCPTEVGGSFYCGNNKLVSFKDCPSEIHGNFWCENNQLTSLVGIHKIIKKLDGFIYLCDNPILEGGIGLLLIEGIKEIDADQPAFKIINKYLSQGKMGILACQEELIEAGYEDFAKL